MYRRADLLPDVLYLCRAVSRILILFFGLFLACLPPYFAQEYIPQVQQYGVEQGMPHHVVRAILQDRRGFIWVGTDQGLSRFDGYRFDSWNKLDNGLQFNKVDDIFEDPDGLLWLFYYRETDNRDDLVGIDIFNSSTGISVSYEHFFAGKLPAGLPPFSSRYAAAEDGTLYLGTRTPAGVLAYHPAKGFRFQVLGGGGAGAFVPGVALPDATLCGMFYQNAENQAHFKGGGAAPATGGIRRELGSWFFVWSASQPRFSRDGSFWADAHSLDGQYTVYQYHHATGTPEMRYRGPREAYEARPVRTLLQQGRLFVRDNRVYRTATGEVVLDLIEKFPAMARNGLSLAQYLDEIRFSQARTLLETRTVQSVKAAAYEVGFTQVEHFSRNFRQRFGRYPSEYLG